MFWLHVGEADYRCKVLYTIFPTHELISKLNWRLPDDVCTCLWIGSTKFLVGCDCIDQNVIPYDNIAIHLLA